MNAAVKEKLVVEVMAAHNLMPKDGEGSSSPFVEIEFENQRQRTQVKYKDLNPIWNEKLVFHINSSTDLPYRTIEANVFNERRSSNSRNFLGKVRVSGSSVGREGEEEVAAQLFSLDKRSLFSHVRGEISLKLYLSTREEVNDKNINSGFLMKKSKKQGVMNNGAHHHLGVEHKVGNHQNLQMLKQGEQNPGNFLDYLRGTTTKMG